MRLLVFLLVGFQLVEVVPAAAPPNIIIILADDLGYGDLSCYGHPTFKTPNLDRMAAEGARLTQFRCPAAFCAPTRASLLTGRYPFRNGMTANPAPDGGPAADAVALPASEVLLPQVLRPGGYRSGIIGKWHLGHQAASLPTERGFDEYVGIPYSNDMRPVHVMEGTEVVEYPVVQATLTKSYTDRAVQFIRQNQARPFFLYLAHAMPHKPLAASETYYRKSGAGLYGDVLAELDASVGRVLEAVKDTAIDERTLVVFTSDNGPWFGGSTGGLRGMKGSTWEGGYRVPLIARWPGVVPAGHVNHGMAVMMDLFVTVLEATGAKMPDDRKLDGRNILPLLTGDGASPHEYVVGHRGEQIANIRDAKWKLHVLAANEMKLKAEADGKWRDPRAPDGVTILAPYEQPNIDAHPGLTSGVAPAPMQLFDLEADPGEQRDVAADHPAVVERLKAAYDQVISEAPARQPPQRAAPPLKP